MSDLDIMNLALLHLGVTKPLTSTTRSTRSDGIVLDSLLELARRKCLIAADWDFATWTADLTLNEQDPNDAVEWSFSYDMPSDPECLKPRRIVNGDRTLTPGSQIPFRVVADVVERAAITAITAANPPVVTATNTFSNGDTVFIVGVLGMTQVNNLRFTVSSRSATQFSLSGITGAAYTAYTSGGSASATFDLIYTDEEDAQLEYTALMLDSDNYPDEFQNAMAYMLAYMAAPGLTGGDPFGLGNKAYQFYQVEISKASARDANKQVRDYPPPESEWIRGR